MAKEIERKFLVDPTIFHPDGMPHRIRQGYLTSDQKRVIRVRTSNEKAFLTIKSSTNGITRDEYEYEIPFCDATELFRLCDNFLVEKTRWEIVFKGKTWEVDIFENENAGLLVAEIELESEDEAFEKPAWAGEEVSTDCRYFNFNLSKEPYSRWQ